MSAQSTFFLLTAIIPKTASSGILKPIVPLVSNNGLMAFHDIAANQKESGSGVDKYCNEIKSDYEYKESVQDQNQRWAGIGLVKITRGPKQVL